MALPLFAEAKGDLEVPLCAIGGIALDNAGAVLTAGADLLAVISTIFSAQDIEQATRALTAMQTL